MKNGVMILLDELSLAEDAVIERLNSVLENKRTLTISEKGADASSSGTRRNKDRSTTNVVVAHPSFLILATMNPGGDFGKRELSPALRNRFTEIWVPAIQSFEDFYLVTLHHLLKLISTHTNRDRRLSQLLKFVKLICEFVTWFNKQFGGSGSAGSQSGQGAAQGLMLTVRDALSWLSFMQKVCPEPISTPNGEQQQEHLVVQEWAVYVHGATMAILDGIGPGSGRSAEETEPIKAAVAKFLRHQIQ